MNWWAKFAIGVAVWLFLLWILCGIFGAGDSQDDDHG